MEIYLGMEAAVKPASPREAGMLLRVMAVTMNNAAARMRGSGDPGAEAGNGWLSRRPPGRFGGAALDWSVKEGLQGTGVSLYFCITGLA